MKAKAKTPKPPAGGSNVGKAQTTACSAPPPKEQPKKRRAVPHRMSFKAGKDI